MVTSIFRLPLPASSGKETIRDLHPNFSMHLTSSECGVRDYMYSNSSDLYFVLTAKSFIEALIYFLESKGVRYMIFDSWLYKSSVESVDSSIRQFLPSIDKPIAEYYPATTKIFLPCGHFAEDVHHYISDLIIDRINNG
jgi:hypothetical protein